MPDRPIQVLEILFPNPLPNMRIRKMPHPPQEAPPRTTGMVWKLCFASLPTAPLGLCVGSITCPPTVNPSPTDAPGQAHTHTQLGSQPSFWLCDFRQAVPSWSLISSSVNEHQDLHLEGSFGSSFVRHGHRIIAPAWLPSFFPLVLVDSFRHKAFFLFFFF